MNLNRKRGVAQLFVVAVMAFLALGLPLTTKLVQQNQENRSKAAEDVIRFAKKTSTIKVIDGVCGSKDRSASNHPPRGTEACKVGRIEFTDEIASDEIYDWFCKGENGGSDGDCWAWVGEVTSVCGSKHGTTIDHEPNGTEACKLGSIEDMKEETDGTYHWWCMGVDGVSEHCMAYSLEVVNGICGIENNQTVDNVPNEAKACKAGSVEYIDTTASDGSYNWKCKGVNGGSTVSCSAARIIYNSACGNAHRREIDHAPRNLTEACKAGSLEYIDTTASDGSYNWKCIGDDESIAFCNATKSRITPTSVPTIITTKTPTPKPKTCSYGGTTYTIGKAICQGSRPAECLSTGSWKLFTACKYGCTGSGICKTAPTPTPKPKTCSYGGTTYAIGKAICQGTRPAECLSTGSWKLFTACKYGCTGSGICKTAPTPTPKPKTCSYGGTTYAIGKAICQGTRPAECLSTGSWKLLTACKYGCTGSGICKTAPTPTPKPVCSAGERVCSGSSLKICQNNTWQVVTNCQYGCLNGSCKAAPTPTKRPTATPTRRPTATPKPVAVNGRCGYSRNSCSSGSFVDTADTRTSYLWRCVGKNGGTSVSCSSRKPASTNTLN